MSALQLREAQLKGVEMLREGFAAGHRCQMLYLPTGGGKCLGIDTPVIMANGSVKKVQHVVIGDQLLGPDGGVRNVLSLARGNEPLYQITGADGSKYIVNESHIISLKSLETGEVLNVNVWRYCNEMIRRKAYKEFCGWRVPGVYSGDFRPVLYSIASVAPIGRGRYFGFEIDGDKLFLLGDFTVTHNTEIAISMMALAADKGNRSAMILDRRNLVNQTSQRLDRYKIDHGVMMAGSGRMRGYEKIQICSAQTLEKRGAASNLQVLFIDEAHQTRLETKRFIDAMLAANPRFFAVGLSASPLTKGLGKIFTNVVCPTTTNALVADNLLIMPTIYCAREIDTDGLKKTAGEWSADDVGERATKITGDIIATWIEKTTLHFGGAVKTLVHCASVAHGAELAQKFADAGFNFVAVSYKDDEDFKLAAYEEFAKPNSKITGLIAVDMLTKGFDVPDVLCSVMARPFSKSVSSVIQQAGRVMRTADGKTHAILIDHAGNFLRHGDQIMQIFEDGIHELDDGAEKPAKEKSIKEKEDCKCPKCQALWRGATDTCAQCGYVRPSRSKVENVAGTVEEFARKALEKTERQSFYSQLLGLAQARGYAEGWAAHKFKEKFDSFPDGLKKTPAQCGPKVANYVRSKQIAWANRRTA